MPEGCQFKPTSSFSKDNLSLATCSSIVYVGLPNKICTIKMVV